MNMHREPSVVPVEQQIDSLKISALKLDRVEIGDLVVTRSMHTPQG